MEYSIKYPDLSKKCIETWGIDAEMFMLVEECGELLQAISKIRRSPTEETRENLQEEVADVMIMLYHTIELYQLKDVQKIMDEKHERLLQRLKTWEKEANLS